MTTLTTVQEDQFERLWGQNINGWTWNFYSALPYVADLVIEGKVKLQQDSDFESIAKPFDTDKHEGEDIYGLFHLFMEMSAPVLDLDTIGMEKEELWQIGMQATDMIAFFNNDPKKVAQFLKQAQENFLRMTTASKFPGFEVEYNGSKIVFYAKPEHGAFYEVGFNGEIGSLYAPMNADGSPDIENVGEIEVIWEEA